MKLIINGEERSFEQPVATVAHLLKQLGRTRCAHGR